MTRYILAREESARGGGGQKKLLREYDVQRHQDGAGDLLAESQSTVLPSCNHNKQINRKENPGNFL